MTSSTCLKVKTSMIVFTPGPGNNGRQIFSDQDICHVTNIIFKIAYAVERSYRSPTSGNCWHILDISSHLGMWVNNVQIRTFVQTVFAHGTSGFIKRV